MLFIEILLVEDEVKLAHAFKRALELQKYAVDVVNNGKKGMTWQWVRIQSDYSLMLASRPWMVSKSCNVLERRHSYTCYDANCKGQISDKVLRS